MLDFNVMCNKCKNDAKRILILGAGVAQENLIRVSKELGYFTIVCDKRQGMPGEKMADRYYHVDYMNKESICNIAKIEDIDGVISNSEPAMISVSYLVDYLGLPGNSVQSIQHLLSKTNFRNLQKDIGLFSPNSFEVFDYNDLIEKLNLIKYPVIIKPSESSGSRGAARFDYYDEEKMKNAFAECKMFSRNGCVTLEEYILNAGSDVYNADVFVVNGKVLWDGWYGGKRTDLLPMVPMAKILPPIITNENKDRIEETVERLLEESGVSLGEFNVETFITDNNEVFVIEINPRQAGDEIPKLIFEHSGIDYTKLLVSLTVNDTEYYKSIINQKRECNYITLQVVFPHKSGVYKGLYIHEDLKNYVCWITEFAKAGTFVHAARNAEDSVAYVDLKFDDRELQVLYSNDIEKYIYPIIS